MPVNASLWLRKTENEDFLSYGIEWLSILFNILNVSLELAAASYISCANGKPNFVDAELSAAKKIMPPPFSLRKRMLEFEEYFAEKNISVSPSLSFWSKTKIGRPALSSEDIRSKSNILSCKAIQCLQEI